MGFQLRILGCNSAIPTNSRFTTAQVLHATTKNYVIDCGEGIQIRINDLKIKKNKIHEVFISHLHGDHFFGLPGLLTSFNLSGRILPLTIYGPIGLKKYILTLQEIGSFYLNFELKIIELNAQIYQKIHSDSELEVFSIPLKHRLPTTGFIFKEKPKQRNILVEAIREKKITIQEIKQLKSNIDVIRPDGSILRYEELTEKPPKPCIYVYCSDTLYDEELVPFIQNATALYHESTYLHDLAIKANERMHSTAKEAALIAKKAKVGKLILGHYSSRYKSIKIFKDEAEQIFSPTILSEDGLLIEI